MSVDAAVSVPVITGYITVMFTITSITITATITNVSSLMCINSITTDDIILLSSSVRGHCHGRRTLKERRRGKMPC